MPSALVRKHRLIQVVIAVRQAPTAGGRRRTTLLAPLSAHPRVHHTRWTSAGPITWIRRCDITHARHTLWLMSDIVIVGGGSAGAVLAARLS